MNNKINTAVRDAVAPLAKQHNLDANATARIEKTAMQAVLTKVGRDTDAKYSAEFKANPNYARMGMSEADYVTSRRLDDGLEPLETEPAGQADQTANEPNPQEDLPPVCRGAHSHGVGSDNF